MRSAGTRAARSGEKTHTQAHTHIRARAQKRDTRAILTHTVVTLRNKSRRDVRRGLSACRRGRARGTDLWRAVARSACRRTALRGCGPANRHRTAAQRIASHERGIRKKSASLEKNSLCAAMPTSADTYTKTKKRGGSFSLTCARMFPSSCRITSLNESAMSRTPFLNKRKSGDKTPPPPLAPAPEADSLLPPPAAATGGAEEEWPPPNIAVLRREDGDAEDGTEARRPLPPEDSLSNPVSVQRKTEGRERGRTRAREDLVRKKSQRLNMEMLER